MNRQGRAAGWLLLLLAGTAAGEEEASPIDGELALRTEYVFRGLTQTEGEVQLQGELGYTHESGFYGGVWSSNTHNGGPGNSVELDPYIGYSAAIGDSGWSYDVGYWHYFYPGAEADLEFGEFYAIGIYEAGALGLRLRLWYADDYFGNDFFSGVSSLAYAALLSYDLGLFEVSARYGEQTFDETAGLPDQDYAYYNVGASKIWGNLTFELGWHNTSGVRPELAPAGNVDERWVVGLVHSF